MLQSTTDGPASLESVQDNSARRIARFLRANSAPARRFLVIAAIAFWLGGFTFYSGVAIPMGVEVLGTHRAVGFITERVTNWLNVAGVVALTILLWNLSLGWGRKGSGGSGGSVLRYTMLITWLLMAAIEVELISLHPVMDRLLTSVPVRDVLDVDRFDLLHHVYLVSTTVQWCLGVIHVWCVCVLWSGTGASPTLYSLL